MLQSAVGKGCGSGGGGAFFAYFQSQGIGFWSEVKKKKSSNLSERWRMCATGSGTPSTPRCGLVKDVAGVLGEFRSKTYMFKHVHVFFKLDSIYVGT